MLHFSRSMIAMVGASILCGSIALADEPEKPASMVVNSSGGSETETLNKVFFDEFSKQTGIQILADSPDSFARFKAEVENGHPGNWAISNVDPFSAIRASAAGYLAPLDPAIVPRTHFMAEAQWPDAFFSQISSFIFAYRTDVETAQQPQNWADFWDQKKFPGPRAMANDPRENLLVALLADGVDPKKLYPPDIDRAFKKMDQIYPYVSVWWSSGAQPMQLLARKEVVMTTGGSNRVYQEIKKGQPFAVGWGGGLLRISGWAIPAGTKDPYWAQKLFAFMQDPKLQAKFASVSGMAPTNTDAVQYLSDDVKPYLATSHLEGSYIQTRDDLKWWAEHGDAVYDRWNKWMLSH